MLRCSVSAVACSRLYRRALSMNTAARVAKSMPISTSYASKRRNPSCRVQTKKPSMVPRAMSGSTTMEAPDSSLATGLRRQALAISLAWLLLIVASSTGTPVSMHW
jgi:hypothetical protein